jgi:hypothetical protein
MATQTKTQRQAAAKKAAATRKRNAAKSSTGSTKASARRTAGSAQGTARSARTTAKQAATATQKRAQAEATRLEAVARQAERAVLIPVGAALEARDRVSETARKYSDKELTRKELNRYERRGAATLKRNRQSIERQAKGLRKDVGQRASEVGDSVGQVVERVRSLA